MRHNIFENIQKGRRIKKKLGNTEVENQYQQEQEANVKFWTKDVADDIPTLISYNIQK